MTKNFFLRIFKPFSVLFKAGRFFVCRIEQYTPVPVLIVGGNKSPHIAHYGIYAGVLVKNIHMKP